VHENFPPDLPQVDPAGGDGESLIDQSQADQLVHERDAPDHDDVLARLALELSDVVLEVAGQHGAPLPLRIGHRLETTYLETLFRYSVTPVSCSVCSGQ
jgi:hypothetical protein